MPPNAGGGRVSASLPATAADANDPLRKQLRAVFAKFDSDGSGTISESELEAVLAAQLSLPRSEVSRMIKEADTDGSGDIDFEEFYVCVKSRKESGGGGLFGLLNPLNWGLPAAEPAPQKAARPASAPSAHKGGDSSTVAFSRATRNSMRAKGKSALPRFMSDPRLEVSRTSTLGDGSSKCVRSQKSVLAEVITKERNAALAEAKRQDENAREKIRRTRHDAFLLRQQQRIRELRQQELYDTPAAIEALNAGKRATGSALRVELAAAIAHSRTVEQSRVEASAAVVKDARRLKQVETAARHEEARRNAEIVRREAAVQRAQRKEESLATVRAQAQAAKDWTAQVRYETRPEVRQVTRDFFQAQRDAAFKEEVEKMEENRVKRYELKKAFLERALENVLEVRDTETGANDARYHLVAQRHREAKQVRRRLQAEQERKARVAQRLARQIQQNHDEVIGQRFDPENSDNWWWTDEAEKRVEVSGSRNLRSGLKSRSKAWSQPKNLDHLEVSVVVKS